MNSLSQGEPVPELPVYFHPICQAQNEIPSSKTKTWDCVFWNVSTQKAHGQLRPSVSTELQMNMGNYIQAGLTSNTWQNAMGNFQCPAQCFFA